MDRLDTSYLSARLGARFSLCAFSTLPSTNLALTDAARRGAPTGSLYVTEEQTDGRGRGGKSFFSPRGSGIYFSLLLDVKDGEDPTLITALAAVAVCRAAESLGADAYRIKWVNDVYRGEKKACGILTQGIFENGRAPRAVVGIGANLLPPKGGFPAEFAARAGALFDAPRAHLREDFVAEVALCLTEIADRETASALNEYRTRQNLFGRRVEVVAADARFFATARAIDENCRLIVEDDRGALITLQSGEVSLVL